LVVESLDKKGNILKNFEQNNQTIFELGQEEALTPEQADQMPQAIAENVADMMTRQPLTEEQGEALDRFFQAL
jgi:hypothetical protein